MTVALREVKRNAKSKSKGKALGTSNGRLVAVAKDDDDDDDSSDRSADGTLRSTLNKGNGRSRAMNSNKKRKLASSSSLSANRRARPQTSSELDSDEDYSSDTVVVASSVRPQAATATKQTASASKKKVASSRERKMKVVEEDVSDNDVDTNDSDDQHVPPKKTVPVPASHKSKLDKGKGKARDRNVDATTLDSDRLPTPESMRLDSGGDSAVSDREAANHNRRRLVKSDKRTPVKQGATDSSTKTKGESQVDRSGAGRQSFLERLDSNAMPQFSKNFKKRVKSGASTSIPLTDERFASDESENDEESDAPRSRQRKPPISKASPRKAAKDVVKQRQQKRQGASSTKAIQIDDGSDASYNPDNEDKGRNNGSGSFSNSDEDLPDLPGMRTLTSSAGKKSDFRDTLGELSKRRQLSDKKQRSREKHSKRIVATPSPSPPPVQVLARRDPPATSSTSASGSGRKKITIRAIDPAKRPPKKKQTPLFRVSDDEEENASDQTDATESSAAAAKRNTQSRKKGKLRSGSSSHGNGKVKGKGRGSARGKGNEDSSSSSSSSSSESLPTDVDSDVSEIVEDIALDFDPVVQDKLRPKDNSKAHRLDKLKQARAAKELREQKRKRGIIDSDEEPVDLTKDDKESEVDSGGGTSSSEEVRNFIVDDDGEVDEDELEAAQRLMPTEFSAHGRLELQDHFHFFITSIVYRYFLPKSRHYKEKKEFEYSKLQLENAINGLINGSITSSIWLDGFRRALDTCPEMIMEPIAYAPGCDGCNKYDRTASQRATLYGKPYNRETLLDDSEAEEEELSFDLGRFCAEKADFHHSLKHTLKKTADIIRAECKKRSTLPKKLMGDKEERKIKREEEAEKVVKILARGQMPVQNQLWEELHSLMERAKHKYLK